ncbi:MAG TPA: DUF542 domain-containing protein, partial [Terriglobales bacterium]|nr:DUF542 domain-containing protein [Terriglobales bacterium]
VQLLPAATLTWPMLYGGNDDSRNINRFVRSRNRSQHPSRVFEKFEIEFCCGGGKPLAEACAAKDVDVETVIARLEAEKGSVRIEAPEFCSSIENPFGMHSLQSKSQNDVSEDEPLKKWRHRKDVSSVLIRVTGSLLRSTAILVKLIVLVLRRKEFLVQRVSAAKGHLWAPICMCGIAGFRK